MPAVLDKLRKAGKMVFFVTNNSTKSRKGYLKKFQELGLDVKPEEIFSSSFAAAAYLEQNPLPAGKKVYIIGQEGICQELDLLNIPYIGGPADSDVKINLGILRKLHYIYYQIIYYHIKINNNRPWGKG